MEVLSHLPVDLSLERVLSRLHIDEDGEDAQSVRELLARVAPIINPKAVYDLSPVGEKRADSLEIGGVIFTSRVLRVNLDQAYRVFAYIATCGTELQNVPGAPKDSLHSYWLDEIRIMALSAATAHLRRHIDSRFKPGRMAHMAPGSLEDWPISQQAQLFSLFPDVEEQIGVRLTDSFLMVPLKSVSGILFPTETHFESCRLCPRAVCPGRRAPYDPRLWEQQYAER
jgi:hypothetical protein